MGRGGWLAIFSLAGCLGVNPAFDGAVESGGDAGTTTGSGPASTAGTASSAGVSSGASGSASASGSAGTSTSDTSVGGTSGDATTVDVCEPLDCDGCEAASREGSDYCFCAVPSDQPTADADCVDRGGRLTSITDDGENDFVRARADDARIGEAWIGFTDLEEEGVWVWLDGTVSDYANWLGSQPDNFKGIEHCAEMEVNARWNDIDCPRVNSGYVCKAPGC